MVEIKRLFVNILITTAMVQAGFVEQKSITSGTIEEVFSTSKEPSKLQCLHRCKFIKDEAISQYDDQENCKCVLIAEKKDGTISDLFTPKKMEPRNFKVINLVTLNAEAKQSSTYEDAYVASKAIDESTSTSSSTKMGNEWLEINLGETRVIMDIHLNVLVYNYRYNQGLVVETQRKKGDRWILCKNMGDVKKEINEFNCNEGYTNAQFFRIRASKECYLRIYDIKLSGY